MGGGSVPVAAYWAMCWAISSTLFSYSPDWTWRPRPVIPRPISACSTAWKAVMPAAMSQTDTPTRAISVSVPVIELKPVSALTRRS